MTIVAKVTGKIYYKIKCMGNSIGRLGSGNGKENSELYNNKKAIMNKKEKHKEQTGHTGHLFAGIILNISSLNHRCHAELHQVIKTNNYAFAAVYHKHFTGVPSGRPYSPHRNQVNSYQEAITYGKVSFKHSSGGNFNLACKLPNFDTSIITHYHVYEPIYTRYSRRGRNNSKEKDDPFFGRSLS